MACLNMMSKINCGVFCVIDPECKFSNKKVGDPRGPLFQSPTSICKMACKCGSSCCRETPLVALIAVPLMGKEPCEHHQAFFHLDLLPARTALTDRPVTACATVPIPPRDSVGRLQDFCVCGFAINCNSGCLAGRRSLPFPRLLEASSVGS
jgi:hypothetical protein